MALWSSNEIVSFGLGPNVHCLQLLFAWVIGLFNSSTEKKKFLLDKDNLFLLLSWFLYDHFNCICLPDNRKIWNKILTAKNYVILRAHQTMLGVHSYSGEIKSMTGICRSILAVDNCLDWVKTRVGSRSPKRSHYATAAGCVMLWLFLLSWSVDHQSNIAKLSWIYFWIRK